MTMITPKTPMIPVCGVRETIYQQVDSPVDVYCVKNKGHGGPHLANLAWGESSITTLIPPQKDLGREKDELLN